MIKITIAIVVLLAAGVVWLRAQWARSKNSSAANEIINDLKSGKYVIESYAETLGILISTKPFPPVFDPASAKNKLQEMTGKQIHEKFSIRYADMNEAGKGIIIAEAKSKDIVAGYGGNKEIDIVCGGPPCQSFSLAGKRKKFDKKDDLFAHYLKVIVS